MSDPGPQIDSGRLQFMVLMNGPVFVVSPRFVAFHWKIRVETYVKETPLISIGLDIIIIIIITFSPPFKLRG